MHQCQREWVKNFIFQIKNTLEDFISATVMVPLLDKHFTSTGSFYSLSFMSHDAMPGVLYNFRTTTKFYWHMAPTKCLSDFSHNCFTWTKKVWKQTPIDTENKTARRSVWKHRWSGLIKCKRSIKGMHVLMLVTFFWIKTEFIFSSRIVFMLSLVGSGRALNFPPSIMTQTKTHWVK